MPQPGEPATAGATHDLTSTGGRAGQGPATPDDALGPAFRTIPEPIELADSPEGRRIEQKLRAEWLARRGGDEEAALADPTGHA